MPTEGAPKYHKSCDYCRYRKVKCQQLEGSESCRHCEACSVRCNYSIKEKSQKRKLKSARIAASLNDENTTSVTHRNSFDINSVDIDSTIATGLSSFLAHPSRPTAATVMAANGEPLYPIQPSPAASSTTGGGCGTPQSISTSSSESTSSPSTVHPQPQHQRKQSYDLGASPLGMTNISANPRPLTHKRTVKAIYTQFVEPFTPFLPSGLFGSDNDDEDDSSPPTELTQLCKCCISLSALTSAEYMTPDATTELLLEVCNALLQQETEWSEATIASVILLASRSILPAGVLSDCLTGFSRVLSPIAGRLESKIVLGAIAADSWNALVSNRPPRLDPSILTDFEFHMREIDDNTFGYYYLTLSQILLRVLFSIHEPTEPFSSRGANTSGSSRRNNRWYQQRYQLLQLESDLLMWPIRLPKHLTVVKDEIIAPNGAVILHCMHNTVLLTLYCHALKTPDTYGRQLAVLPVPGLLQFATGMAKSTFKCGGHMWHRWPLLRQCQVLTAHYMLDLYESTEYEFCKRALVWWIDDQIDPPVYKRVCDLLGDTDWIEHSDGAVVFWVYRDVRSMSIDILLADAKDGGDCL